LWTLEGLNAIDWSSVERALADPEVQVAVAGARLAERFFADEPNRTLAALKQRATWGELAFQQQLALSLSAAHAETADALLSQIALTVGDRPYIADAIVSSAAGRELRLFMKLAEGDESARAATTPVLASLAAAVLKSSEAASIEQLLGLLDPKQEWLNAAIIEGVERFVPGEQGKERTVFLPEEPQALAAFAKSESAHASRARDMLKYIRWQGQKIDAERAVASLTEAQRKLYERGKQEFVVCASCHQPDGQGQEGLAPPLVGSRWVTGGVDALVRIVINGKTSGASTMPPLRALDDGTIASILTYIRRSWGHESEPIPASQVRYIRGQIDERHEPWTEAELEPMN
jgi:mono/diheme cytochrome c family protein